MTQGVGSDVLLLWDTQLPNCVRNLSNFLFDFPEITSVFILAVTLCISKFAA